MSEGLSGSCWKCGAELSPADYGRSQSCTRCDADTKCCRNCEFYAPKVSRECSEPIAEPPGDKEKANFCDLFRPCRPRPAKPAAGSAAPGKKAPPDARAAFEALFKKKTPPGQ